MSIPLHQTVTSAKKGQWHITHGGWRGHAGSADQQRYMPSLCSSGTYWNGGYHQIPSKRCDPPMTTYDGTQGLCPACVEQAYIAGMVKIVEVEDA